ncbi:MAG: 4-phosphoerythronate dehydrogenase [Acidobacteriia bacterium]|nr:4-phosphoerythronate dehydrogenase [Terriglobia bacterium]
MIIVVDEAIPYWQAAFARTGEIRAVSARSVRPADCRDADALIVRSVTRVGSHLLEGSSIRFVGTATIGVDHLDLDYLKARRIHIANAPGSNANAVAEYVVAALLVLAERKGWRLPGKSIGIIGVGHIGTLVEKKASALGLKTMLCDPPLRESTGDTRYGFFDDVIRADILSLHVPLTTTGPYPTWHMLDRKVLQRLSPRQTVINTSRGAVVSESDLRQTLRDRRIEGAVLDVWEGEPRIDHDLLDLVDLGSPHIAGYSLDGKVRATAMVREELCRFFGIQESWDTRNIFPQPQRLRPQAGMGSPDAVRSVVLQAYDILRDDMSLRALKGVPGDAAAERFDRLRTDNPLRREFSHFTVELVEGKGLAQTFTALGFEVAAGFQ